MILGVSLEEYPRLDAKVRKAARQRAKVANFGFPGGLGIVKFAAWAKAEYGITFTQSEVRALKEKWLAAYPEMLRYMAEDAESILAFNLGITPADVKRCAGQHMRYLTDVIRGYFFAEGLWNKLLAVVKLSPRREDIEPLLAEGQGSPTLGRKLLTVPSVTLTGRVRSRCIYTEARNTPFQGVAGDGGKLALWRLYYEGFDVRAFVHDEFIVAYKGRPTPAVLKRARDIMEKSMEEVIGQGVPVLIEPGELTTKWTK